jgi:hypothetical protein
MLRVKLVESVSKTDAQNVCRAPQKAKPVPVKEPPKTPRRFYFIVLLVYIFVTIHAVTSVLSSTTVSCLLYGVHGAGARLREF